ncbi:MAG: recombinase family protein, partial [Clostridia bacterium]|nr:recombinase family protein [Clostridia bacterium]
MIIDESVKDIIKNIFDWYVNEGIGKIAICHRLNDMGILNPTGHKKIELGQNYNNYGIKDDKYTWSPSTVRNILCNEIYCGNIVQGKRRTKSYKLHKVEQVPKEEWVKIENTHEAIIDKEIFEKSQELSRRDTRVLKKTNELSLWAGILKCNDCKRAMNKKSSSNNRGKVYEYYICSTYRRKSNSLCTKHTIKVENLERAVLETINLHVDTLENIGELINEIKKSKYQKTKGDSFEEFI